MVDGFSINLLPYSQRRRCTHGLTGKSRRENARRRRRRLRRLVLGVGNGFSDPRRAVYVEVSTSPLRHLRALHQNRRGSSHHLQPCLKILAPPRFRVQWRTMTI